MGNRRYVPREAKEEIIKLSETLTAREVAQTTGVSEKTVRQTVNLWKQTGSIGAEIEIPGRPRLLGAKELHVS